MRRHFEHTLGQEHHLKHTLKKKRHNEIIQEYFEMIDSLLNRGKKPIMVAVKSAIELLQTMKKFECSSSNLI